MMMYDLLHYIYLTCPLRMEILVASSAGTLLLVTSHILQCLEGHTLRYGIAGAKRTILMDFSGQVACPQRRSMCSHWHFPPGYPLVRYLLVLRLIVLLGGRSFLIYLSEFFI